MKEIPYRVDSLGEASDAIEQELQALGAEPKSIAKSLLLAEEVSMRFFELGQGTELTAVVRKRFGRVQLSIQMTGEEIDPLEEIKDWSVETEDYYRTLILRANQSRMTYCRKNGRNIVEIRVQDSKRRLPLYSALALPAGLVVGMILLWLCPQEVTAFVRDQVIGPFQELFFDALNMLVVPVVFCSIVCTLTGLSSLSDAGRLGGKTVGVYTITTLLAIAVGFGVSLVGFPKEMATGELVTQMTGAFSPRSVTELLDSIVPKNLLQPILEGNLMQILYLSVFTGIALSLLGDAVRPVKTLIESLNRLFGLLVSLIGTFVPVVVFAASISVIVRFGAQAIPALGLFLLTEVVGMVLIFLIYAILIRVFAGLSPMPFLRNARTMLSDRETDSSSNLPKAAALCTGKLGISQRVALFTTSLGNVINMDNSCVHLVICSVLLGRLYGLELTGQTIVNIVLMVLILSIGSAAVPNSGFVALSSLTSMLGVPAVSVGLLIGVDQALDYFRTTNNTIGDVAAAVVVAKSEQEIDTAKYNQGGPAPKPKKE